MIQERWNCNTCNTATDNRHHVLFPDHDVKYSWNYTDDPFVTTSHCIERLVKEYRAHPKLIVACDYDDTVFDFHQKGQTHQDVIDVLKRCNAVGFYVVLFTASDPSRFDTMKTYLAEQGVVVDAVNENPIVLKYGNHRKIYYNILLDDRAGLGQAMETLKGVLDVAESERRP